MGGQPVVDTASGELDETAELAIWILDTTFHPRATLFSGTADANNAGINVGDVVLSGYVVDKSQIHYQLGGYQTDYSGIELHAVAGSDAAGAIIDSYGNVYPTPADAKNFDSGSDPTGLKLDLRGRACRGEGAGDHSGARADGQQHGRRRDR